MAEQREIKAKTSWRSPRTICIIFLFIAAVVALMTIAIVQSKPISQKYKYGIVLDAGSSHTSVYIYEWPAEKENNTGMVRQLDTCDVEGKGISSYANNVSQAGNSLKKCMDKAKKSVPKAKHGDTPVYLGATAGMRLLSMENKRASDEVMASVERTLRNTPFDYQGARIISGQEEGAFGWITVNYLSDNFRQAKPTMGALDLGGASTQITFVSKQSSVSPENSIDFRLYGKDYQLYTHSFLCYGKDQVLKLAMAHQLETDEYILHDPCFHPGYKVNKSLGSVFNSPCAKTFDEPSRTFTHIGEGKWEECRNSIRKVFNFSDCSFSSCSFNRVYQPKVEGMFGAFSAYYFVMNFLNLTTHSLEESKMSLSKYCSTSWSEIKSNHPKVKDKYLAEYCFSATYILTLLEDGYKFTPENWNDINFIDKIENSNAGWTLGYMLNLTNMIPAEAPDTPPLTNGGFVTVMLFLSMAIIVLLALSCKFFGRPSCSSPKEII
ncbi:ectonucleoside triphosphate diphosphohydrolase 1 isoform X2 [Denticeps clupeoides]|uniref:Ectonucleoside triphosphate diphosphohydrolase 1 n=1 Tax=Denticeps clupeoides TaxID=299321 RepID=A0AAY4EZ73_9TELE|nr:ectonucleoside triphosphate diphosphohydrolase 1 isoform X2 [Denticeps clupeoides]